MEAPVEPVTPSRRNKAPLLAVVLLVIVVAVAAIRLLPRKNSGWDAAAFIPKDVVVAGTVDLTRSPDKDAALEVLAEILLQSGAQDQKTALSARVNKFLGVDFEQEVLPRLNGLAGGAVLPDLMGMVPGVVAVVGTRSEGDARALMDLIAQRLSKEKLSVEKRTHQNVPYLYITVGPPPGRQSPMFTPQAGICLAAIKDAVVGTSNISAFLKTVATVKGQPSLQTDPNFTSMRKTGEGYFACTYYSGPGCYQLIRPILQMSAAVSGGQANTEAAKQSIENTVAVVSNASASQAGIRVNIKTKQTVPSVQLDMMKLTDLVSVVPQDAAVVFSIGSVQKMLAEMKQQFASNPVQKMQADQMLSQFKQKSGVDLFADLLDHVTQLTIYYRPNKDARHLGPVSYVVTVDQPDIVKPAVQKLANYAVKAGKQIKPLTVAGEQVSVMPMDHSGKTMGFLVSGNTVIATLAETGLADSISTAIASARGNTANVTQSEGFHRIASQLPRDSAFLVYGDLNGFLRPPNGQESSAGRKAMAAVNRKISAFTATGNLQEAEILVPFKH